MIPAWPKMDFLILDQIGSHCWNHYISQIYWYGVIYQFIFMEFPVKSLINKSCNGTVIAFIMVRAYIFTVFFLYFQGIEKGREMTAGKFPENSQDQAPISLMFDHKTKTARKTPEFEAPIMAVATKYVFSKPLIPPPLIKYLQFSRSYNMHQLALITAPIYPFTKLNNK